MLIHYDRTISDPRHSAQQAHTVPLSESENADTSTPRLAWRDRSIGHEYGHAVVEGVVVELGCGGEPRLP